MWFCLVLFLCHTFSCLSVANVTNSNSRMLKRVNCGNKHSCRATGAICQTWWHCLSENFMWRNYGFCSSLADGCMDMRGTSRRRMCIIARWVARVTLTGGSSFPSITYLLNNSVPLTKRWGSKTPLSVCLEVKICCSPSIRHVQIKLSLSIGQADTGNIILRQLPQWVSSV